MVFDEYANFYDLLYGDKDYRKECEFVERIFQTYGGKKIKTVLDLGCGTGSHALLLADMGYTITGVDFSEKMLRIARTKAGKQDKRISFLQADIRSLNLKKKFDAVLCMFAVLSYQVTNQDIENTMQAVRSHLNPGGLFIFDVWFGPAVLHEKPSERVKTVGDDDSRVVRRVKSALDIISHTAKVDYTLSEMRQGRRMAEVKESHLMRFFFYQEIVSFLERNGFEVVKICPFIDTEGQVSESTWNISVVAKSI